MRTLISIVLVLISTCVSYSQVSLEGLKFEYGPYQVGFDHYTTTDSTRTYHRIYDWTNQSSPRPIPVSIWYPSSSDQEFTQPMSVLDYMRILKEEEEWEYLPDEQILNWFYYSNTPENQEHLAEKSRAYSGIMPQETKVPVLVYAPSYQASSIENFALCEYLASHGYFVISSPSRGADTRFFEGATAKDLETQARDIEFLIKESSKFAVADNESIASMGFSFGGLSNVLSQMRNSSIDAIVSLDGSIKYQISTIKESPFYNISKVDVPFIHLAQKDIPEQVLKDDNIDAKLNTQFEFYDSLANSAAYKLKFHNLTHSYFSTLGLLFEKRDPRQDKTDAEIMESYRLASLYTLNFLNAFLKKDEGAIKFINAQPSENGVSEELVSLEMKESVQQPFDFEDFNDMAAKQEYQNLEELYRTTVDEYPGIQLPEGKLNNLGLQLVFNPDTSNNGIAVLKLATTIYPNSSNLFDSLAEAYLFVGDRENAKASFQKSLELDSQNQNAIDRLKQLEE